MGVVNDKLVSLFVIDNKSVRYTMYYQVPNSLHLVVKLMRDDSLTVIDATSAKNVG